VNHARRRLNSCLACWGRGSSAVRGAHINKPAVGGKARGSWARPDVRAFGLYSRSNAARQADAAVLSFGDDPAREWRRRRQGVIRWRGWGRSRARVATACHGTDAVWPVATRE
jgi:hypothetical protein